MHDDPDDEYRFTASRFPIDATERDRAFNPGCYGYALAEYIAAGLRARGVNVGEDDVFAEDWGWCIAAQRKSVAVYVGCSNIRDPNEPLSDTDIPGEDVEWRVFTFAERGLIAWLRRADPSSHRAPLHALVGDILRSEPSVRWVE